jgi:hypothetical protein
MTLPVSPTISDRMWAYFRALVRAEDPNRDYRGVWEYFVQSTNGTACDLAPTDPTISLPVLRNVPMRAGLPGTIGTPAIGSKVYVTFANGDPSKPFVVGYDDSPPHSITLAQGGHGVAFADAVLTELGKIATALTTHVHAGVTTGGGTSGTAASTYTPATSVGSSTVSTS